jgi:hypothetical protein
MYVFVGLGLLSGQLSTDLHRYILASQTSSMNLSCLNLEFVCVWGFFALLIVSHRLTYVNLELTLLLTLAI